MVKRASVFILAVAIIMMSAIESATADAANRKFIRITISEQEIVIFSKSYCPYCRKAEGVFQEPKKTPFVVELDQREDGSDIQNAMSKIVGRRTVPQVFINEKHLGGSDDTVDTYKSGKLAKLLNITEEDEGEL